MLHGKRGFERLVWACKNVLNNSLTWLFHNFQPPSGETGTNHVAQSSLNHTNVV
jgi:ribonuclease P/MRP protein subunit RPP40